MVPPVDPEDWRSNPNSRAVRHGNGGRSRTVVSAVTQSVLDPDAGVQADHGVTGEARAVGVQMAERPSVPSGVMNSGGSTVRQTSIT